MALRQKLFSSITKVFKRHGGITIDTPVFELREVLMGKYGEDSKLIYDLKDQGGEICSLRYDLTVPFGRYLAMTGIQNIKRYQIAKVYRRDNPSVNKGRMREFYQCDFDIAGVYEKMVPDAEVLKLATEILSALPIGEYEIKLNHRKVLDGMFKVCGVPDELIRGISSAVDKLDKMEWKDVKKEMVEVKGLDPQVADRIHTYVQQSGGPALVESLLQSPLKDNADALEGLQELELLFTYLNVYEITPKIRFDMSLARGLDYYTGIIYEAVFKSTSDATAGIGSIAAGGRYDNLVGMFSSKTVPCVGISIGVERVFAILSQLDDKSKPRASPTNVYVTSPDGHLVERMKIANELWKAGVNTEFTYKPKVKIGKELSGCDGKGIGVVVIVGKSEIESGIVKIKDLQSQVEYEVTREEMVKKVKEMVEEKEDIWDLNVD